MRDVARSLEFSRDVDGVRFADRFDHRFVEFDVGGATFAIDAESFGEPRTPNSIAGTVTVSEVVTSPVCHGTVKIEHDGNRLAIHERNANVSP